MVEDSFEPKLIDALQPIRLYTLSSALYHLFETGLFDSLRKDGKTTIKTPAEYHGLDFYRLEGFLKYLKNEGIVNEHNGFFSLSKKGRSFADFQA